MIAKELAPKPEKLLVMDISMLSIAVKIPTSAIMPNAMIIIVSIDLRRLDRTLAIASFIFSKGFNQLWSDILITIIFRDKVIKYID